MVLTERAERRAGRARATLRATACWQGRRRDMLAVRDEVRVVFAVLAAELDARHSRGAWSRAEPVRAEQSQSGRAGAAGASAHFSSGAGEGLAAPKGGRSASPGRRASCSSSSAPRPRCPPTASIAPSSSLWMVCSLQQWPPSRTGPSQKTIGSSCLFYSPAHSLTALAAGSLTSLSSLAPSSSLPSAHMSICVESAGESHRIRSRWGV